MRRWPLDLKIQLPGIDGTMSVNFLFILLGVVELSLPETLVLGCTATLAQCVCSARGRNRSRQNRVQRLQHDGECRRNIVLRLSRFAQNARREHAVAADLTALIFFLANTVPVSVIISLTEGNPA